MMKFVAALCLLVVLFASAEAKVSKGHKSATEFMYLDKFCYGYGNGTLQIDITVKDNITSPLYLALYDDQGSNWTDVYHHSMTCEDRLAMIRGSPIQLQFVNTSAQINHEVIFWDHQRPHFWYFTLISCGQSLSVDYDMTMLQQSNSKWVKQFSFDQQGLEGLYLFYFIMFLIGGAVHGYAIWSFMQTGSYHTLVKLYTFSVALEGLSVFCLFIHYAVYADNGVGAPGLKGIGDLLDIAAQIVFMLLVILIAKGWCISKTVIDDTKYILGGLGVVILLYLAMFIWVNVGVDPATTTYMYQTAPGIIIVVLRCLIMLYFIYCMRTTYLEENNASKRKFYMYFGIIYLLWFISLPFIVSIAAGLNNNSPWVCEKTVMIIYVTFNFVFLVVLGTLLWPSRAAEFFQITTRDIGSMPYESI